jgi:hypothetical protein
MEVIAERALVCEGANGKRTLVTLRIGRPYRSGDIDWACPVALAGLYKRLADQHGIDSLLNRVYGSHRALRDKTAQRSLGRHFTSGDKATS